MGMIIWALAVVGTIFLGVIVKILADEFGSWNPVLVNCLLKRAILKLPTDLRDRCEEEWRGHIAEIPGDLGKLIDAFGFVSAASKMSAIRRTSLLRAAATILSAESRILIHAVALREMFKYGHCDEHVGSDVFRDFCLEIEGSLRAKMTTWQLVKISLIFAICGLPPFQWVFSVCPICRTSIERYSKQVLTETVHFFGKGI